MRHNEDELNGDLASTSRYAVDRGRLDDAHVKAHLLLQCHVSRARMPIADYETDAKSVLDQAVRVLQAMVDVAGHVGIWDAARSAMRVMQSLKQATWHDDPAVAPWMASKDAVPSSLRHAHDDSEENGDVITSAGVDRWDEVKRAAKRVMEDLKATTLAEVVAKDDAELRRAFGRAAPSAAALLRQCVPHVTAFVAVEKGVAGDLAASDDDDVIVTLSFAGGSSRAHAPRFPKAGQTSGFWLVAHETDGNGLLAIKRIGMPSGPGKQADQGKQRKQGADKEGNSHSSSRSVTASLRIPPMSDYRNVSVSLISDTYVGLEYRWPVVAK